MHLESVVPHREGEVAEEKVLQTPRNLSGGRGGGKKDRVRRSSWGISRDLGLKEKVSRLQSSIKKIRLGGGKAGRKYLQGQKGMSSKRRGYRDVLHRSKKGGIKDLDDFEGNVY